MKKCNNGCYNIVNNVMKNESICIFVFVKFILKCAKYVVKSTMFQNKPIIDYCLQIIRMKLFNSKTYGHADYTTG